MSEKEKSCAWRQVKKGQNKGSSQRKRQPRNATVLIIRIKTLVVKNSKQVLASTVHILKILNKTESHSRFSVQRSGMTQLKLENIYSGPCIKNTD